MNEQKNKKGFYERFAEFKIFALEQALFGVLSAGISRRVIKALADFGLMDVMGPYGKLFIILVTVILCTGANMGMKDFLKPWAEDEIKKAKEMDRNPKMTKEQVEEYYKEKFNKMGMNITKEHLRKATAVA